MTILTATLDISVRLHLTGNRVYTTVALTDAPQPELTSLNVEGLSLLKCEHIEGLDGIPGWINREINLSPQRHGEDRFARFIENLLTALNGEAEEALLEAGE